MKGYVDTNVLVYAFAAAGHPQREPARAALAKLGAEGQLATSFLAVDEFIWATRRLVPYAEAVAAAARILDLPLDILPIGEREGRRALRLMQAPGLQPHDATHAAVALENGCSRILSTDPDFDRVKGLRRVGLE